MGEFLNLVPFAHRAGKSRMKFRKRPEGPTVRWIPWAGYAKTFCGVD